MSLTAREWLLLPKEEQTQRGKELSAEECFKLRMELSMIHFSEKEKTEMSEQQKYDFIHPKNYTQEEKEKHTNETKEIFRRMQNKK